MREEFVAGETSSNLTLACAQLSK